MARNKVSRLILFSCELLSHFNVFLFCYWGKLRLQNSTPVSYSEVALTKKDGLLEDENIMQEVGSKPEIYTEEHEKLLGNTERSWTLFVDGCGKDGKRIYDPINGKTCHQCRSACFLNSICMSSCAKLIF